MLKVKAGKFAGKEITKVINQNEKFAKVIIENDTQVTIPASNMEEVKTDLVIENRTYKNVLCADGKERFLIFHNDGSIEYCTNKNGKPWGVGRLIKRESFLQLPKWSTEEIKRLIKGE
ncbi:hypothetical protein P4V41_07335 [Fictibacillus nanhaiensis]|uniref:hypothetical protein n=1 Tax=Fictibacillus nanhaiensis TaxID=742169 RepID=UPI002E1CE8EE|nr:hypothetical protein [Fictibacillus nanhaiensis]